MFVPLTNSQSGYARLCTGVDCARKRPDGGGDYSHSLTRGELPRIYPPIYMAAPAPQLGRKRNERQGRKTLLLVLSWGIQPRTGWYLPASAICKLAGDAAEAYGNDQNGALEDILVEGGGAEDGEAVEADADDQDADEGAGNVELAIFERGRA